MRLGVITYPGIPPVSEDPVTWMVKQVADLGLSTINTGVGRWKEAGYLEGLRGLLEHSGIEIIPCFGGNYVATGREADPTNLPLNIELSFIPRGMDTRPWVLESIAYCRERFGEYLKKGTGDLRLEA